MSFGRSISAASLKFEKCCFFENRNELYRLRTVPNGGPALSCQGLLRDGAEHDVYGEQALVVLPVLLNLMTCDEADNLSCCCQKSDLAS